MAYDYDRLLTSLRGRGFLPQLLPNAAQAREAALSILGARSVGFGGSATIQSLGLYEALKARGNEVFWHWYEPPEARIAVERRALQAEAFLTSSNAVLTDGRLVNIDGTGNRVAGLLFGPPLVVVVLGCNKIVDGTVDDAVARIRREGCPGNARRLGLDTPCARTGRCADCRTGRACATSWPYTSIPRASWRPSMCCLWMSRSACKYGEGAHCETNQEAPAWGRHHPPLAHVCADAPEPQHVHRVCRAARVCACGARRLAPARPL